MKAISGAVLWCVTSAALGAGGELAYVSNEDDHTVSIIDVARAQVIGAIEVGKRPRGLKLTRDGSTLYVALSGLPKCPPTTPDEECAQRERDLKADGVAVVDTRTRTLRRVLQAGSDPEQFALSIDETRLFVANEDAATASVVDIASGRVVARLPVGDEPEGVVASPDGRWVLVTNEANDSLSVIDARELKVVNTVRVGKRPRDLAFASNGRSAYVSGELDASLYRMRVPEGAPVERVLTMRKEARPMGVILDERRRRLYLSTGRGGSVAVIDLEGKAAAKEIPVGTRPWGVAVSRDGRKLYTANGPSNDVTVVNLDSLEVERKISVGRSPWGVVIGPAPK